MKLNKTKDNMKINVKLNYVLKNIVPLYMYIIYLQCVYLIKFLIIFIKKILKSTKIYYSLKKSTKNESCNKTTTISLFDFFF